ncbi:hypothetical protein JHK84_031392 [Glycine max]|nr:hypothetical protein JHK84_031392 [Glycine max]
MMPTFHFHKISSLLGRLDTFNDLEVTLRNSGDNDLEEHVSITSLEKFSLSYNVFSSPKFSQSQEFGNGFTPHYLAPSTIGPIVLKGVNYASGGGGIFVTIMISKLRVQLIEPYGRRFGPLSKKELESLERKLDSSLKQTRSIRVLKFPTQQGWKTLGVIASKQCRRRSTSTKGGMPPRCHRYMTQQCEAATGATEAPRQ